MATGTFMKYEILDAGMAHSRKKTEMNKGNGSGVYNFLHQFSGNFLVIGSDVVQNKNKKVVGWYQ